MLRRLDNVDAGVKEFFAPAAQLVLESDDPHNAMCAALAALSGLMEVPKPRRWGPFPVLSGMAESRPVDRQTESYWYASVVSCVCTSSCLTQIWFYQGVQAVL